MLHSSHFENLAKLKARKEFLAQFVSAIRSGATGSGKTVHCLYENAPLIGQRNAPALVVIDPHGTLAESFALKALEKGLIGSDRFVYDPLSKTANVPGYEYLKPSTHQDQFQRAAENRERIEEAKSILLRHRNVMDANNNPMIDEGLTNVLSLFINQKSPVPFAWMMHAFSRESDVHHYLIANCADAETQRVFAFYQGLPPREWEFACGPAGRILRKICQSPQFQVRTQATFCLETLLNRGGMLLLDGSSKGNLARTDMATIMGMVILQVIQLARNGRLGRHVILIIDEGPNAGLIDGNVARAMAEGRKWNLSFELMVQNPLTFSPDRAIIEGVYQNARRQYWFMQMDYEAIRHAASVCASANYDPHLIHSVQTRTRLEHAGFEEFDVVNTSSWESNGRAGTGTSKNRVSRPRYAEREEETVRYLSPADQQAMFMRKFQSLEVGWHFFRFENFVSPEPIYTPMERTLWHGLSSKNPKISLAVKKLHDALDAIKDRPEYQSRNLPELPKLETPQGRGINRLGRQSKRQS